MGGWRFVVRLDARCERPADPITRNATATVPALDEAAVYRKLELVHRNRWGFSNIPAQTCDGTRDALTLRRAQIGLEARAAVVLVADSLV